MSCCQAGTVDKYDITDYSTSTPQKPTHFDGHYLRNCTTLDIGVLGYIGIVWPKEHSPEVSHIPPVTPCILVWTFSQGAKWSSLNVFPKFTKWYAQIRLLNTFRAEKFSFRPPTTKHHFVARPSHSGPSCQLIGLEYVQCGKHKALIFPSGWVTSSCCMC